MAKSSFTTEKSKAITHIDVLYVLFARSPCTRVAADCARAQPEETIDTEAHVVSKAANSASTYKCYSYIEILI